jgi:hypothetical protein
MGVTSNNQVHQVCRTRPETFFMFCFASVYYCFTVILFFITEIMSSRLAVNLEHIGRLAMLIRALCALGGITLLLLPLALWSQPSWVAEEVKKERGGLAATALPTGVSAWALWEIWSLFGCYARGDLLSLQLSAASEAARAALMSLAAAMPLGQTLTVLALTLDNPPGHRTLWFGLSPGSYLSLLFGLVLLAVSTVLAEAATVATVADENAEFV